VSALLARTLGEHKVRVIPDPQFGEASWAPDDVLNDKSLYHTFKLFTDAEFDNAAQYAAETHERGGKKYYRAKGRGGLPYKADHPAYVIADIAKLRAYSDCSTQRHPSTLTASFHGQCLGTAARLAAQAQEIGAGCQAWQD
jgi:hypothetical protein